MPYLMSLMEDVSLNTANYHGAIKMFTLHILVALKSFIFSQWSEWIALPKTLVSNDPVHDLF